MPSSCKQGNNPEENDDWQNKWKQPACQGSKYKENHSVIAQLLKEGKITLDEAKSHPQKNTLTNALGVWHVFRIDINKIENTYKYLLVSSDGLHGYVEKKVISDIVHDSSLSLQEKTETLIARANQSGGYDNCTVILMENDGE